MQPGSGAHPVDAVTCDAIPEAFSRVMGERLRGRANVHMV